MPPARHRRRSRPAPGVYLVRMEQHSTEHLHPCPLPLPSPTHPHTSASPPARPPPATDCFPVASLPLPHPVSPPIMRTQASELSSSLSIPSFLAEGLKGPFPLQYVEYSHSKVLRLFRRPSVMDEKRRDLRQRRARTDSPTGCSAFGGCNPRGWAAPRRLRCGGTRHRRLSRRPIPRVWSRRSRRRTPRASRAWCRGLRARCRRPTSGSLARTRSDGICAPSRRSSTKSCACACAPAPVAAPGTAPVV